MMNKFDGEVGGLKGSTQRLNGKRWLELLCAFVIGGLFVLIFHTSPREYFPAFHAKIRPLFLSDEDITTTGPGYQPAAFLSLDPTVHTTFQRPSSFFENLKATRPWFTKEHDISTPTPTRTSTITTTRASKTTAITKKRPGSYLAKLDATRLLSSSDVVITDEDFNPDGINVHYFRLYPNGKTESASPLSFMECMSVLSVMKNLAPDAIYFHTNIPNFWPFKLCESFKADWHRVTITYSPPLIAPDGNKVFHIKHYTDRRTAQNEENIFFVEHEADIKKLEAVLGFGGLILDFDAFMINGTAFREKIKRFECLGCRESYPKLNAGFLYCRKGAYYPRFILNESYVKDYRPTEWVWNSGELPFKLYEKNRTMLEVVDGVCNSPDPQEWQDFLRTRKYGWRHKIAHHTFAHDHDFPYTAENVNSSQSSMADMVQWIMNS